MFHRLSQRCYSTETLETEQREYGIVELIKRINIQIMLSSVAHMLLTPAWSALSWRMKLFRQAYIVIVMIILSVRTTRAQRTTRSIPRGDVLQRQSSRHIARKHQN